MRRSKQALAFLKYLRDEGAYQASEEPGPYGSIRGFLRMESDEHFQPGKRQESKLVMGARYNSVHRTVIKLFRGEYITREVERRVQGFDYKITEKGLEMLRSVGLIE